MRMMVIIASVVAVGEASAQVVIDKSDEALPEADRALLVQQIAASDLRDPLAVQLRRLRATDQSICGELNTKNGFGAFIGFLPFGIGRTGGALALFDPHAIERDVAGEESVRELGCYDDGTPESEWKGLSMRRLSCMADLGVLADNQGPEPLPGGRDFNELFASLKVCVRDRLIPENVAARWGLL